jgi:septum formation protein
MSDVYLASRSARRRELLKQIGVKFEPLMLRLSAPRGADVDESRHDGESPGAYVERVAREKADCALRILGMRALSHKPVLAADTVVICDDDVLGKPANPDEAAIFLKRLSGRTHEVRTAVAVTSPALQGVQALSAVSLSQVTFRELSEAEIKRYCETAEPYDKAGGYAIQGLAAVFIERLEGSYSGVMGLPLAETAQLLARAGVKVL